jgi:hypothetical protein
LSPDTLAALRAANDFRPLMRAILRRRRIKGLLRWQSWNLEIRQFHN